VGAAGDSGTRIENRMGEPAANPYLTVAAQIHAGLDGLLRQLRAPPATDHPYGQQAERLPTSLPQALQALQSDTALVEGFGPDFVAWFAQIKASEIARHAAAEDPADFDRREYFARF